MATASSIAAQIDKNRIFQGFCSKKWDFPERQKRVAPENPVLFCDKSLSGTATPESSMGHRNSTYSAFPLKGTHFLRNVLLSGEILNMLNPGGHVESKCA